MTHSFESESRPIKQVNETALARSRNKKAWDRLVDQGNRFAKPAKDGDLHRPLELVDARGWLGGDIRGKSVLCLAAGGGKHSVIYAATGASVTVVDISSEMLALDRQVAAERGIDIRTIEASMDSMPMLPDNAFDIVIHPVSTCYLPNIGDIFSEVARVTRGGGVYVSQHKTPTNLQCSQAPNARGAYELEVAYYERSHLDAVANSPFRESGTWEYIHTWEAIVGGICRAGFVIEDLVEPMHAKADSGTGEFGHRCSFVAPYVRIKARRAHQDASIAKANEILLP